jgi:hypothetical protein
MSSQDIWTICSIQWQQGKGSGLGLLWITKIKFFNWVIWFSNQIVFNLTFKKTGGIYLESYRFATIGINSNSYLGINSKWL